MNTQKLLNMNIGNYTKTLRDDLRKSLLITLTLLFVCPGVWGQGTQPSVGDGTEGSPYQITSAENLAWVCSHGGYAKLYQSLEGSINFIVSNNIVVTIDLNGLTIKDTYYETYHQRRTNTPIFRVTQGSSLTILDSSNTQEGKITGAYSKCESSLSYNGGGILNYGTVTIKSGKITDNHVVDSGSGGGIFNASGATLKIEGGEISGNSAYDYGGGIYNAAGATLTITGGTITENSCYYRTGGGIYNLGTLNISGKPTINTNSKSYYSSVGANDIFLTTGTTITIGTGGLTCAANSIGIIMETSGTFTTCATSENDYTKFFSNDNHYEAVAVSIDGDAGNNNVKLKSCWSLLDKQIAEATSGSTITLTKDYEAVTTDTYLSVPNSQNITIDLNGYKLNRNTTAKADGCVIMNLGELIITDTSTGHSGTIRGGNNTNGGGGIHNEGTLHFNGGTISNNASGYSGGGIYNAGTLEICGDNTIIRDNSTTKLGAGIYNESGKSVTINSGTIQSNTNNGEHGGGIYNKGTLTINGGSISNNTLNTASKHGGGVYNAGTLSINGGTIQNNTVKNNTGLGAGIYHDGTTFNLQGAPDISSNKIVNTSTQRNVYLTTDKKITITGALSNETAISLNMQTLGEFTTGFKTYDCSLDKFSSEAGATVKLTNYNADYSLKEAELITYWSYLNRQFSDNNISSITLEAGTYQATSTEPYLHVPNRTVSLNLNGQTLNRNVGNTAKQDGCVLYNEGILTITGTGTIRGGNNNGTGTAQGGGIYNTGKLYLQGGSIYRNYTSINGGGIYNAGELTFSGGYVSENWATESGNGIYNHTGGIMTLSGGTIQGNSHTAGNGGGIYNNGTLTVTSGTISGNEVNVDGKHGGGVYNVGTMTFSGGNIQSNWAKGNGGGIYNNGELTMSGGSILNNGYYTSGNSTYYRGENGTGIYNNGTLNLTGGTITGNRFDGSSKEGAGIYNNGTFNLEGEPTITDNTRNVYLPKAHHIINITGTLTNATPIGIRMETPGVFTSGLKSGIAGQLGTSANFTSENSANHRLIDTEDTHEAALATHWNYLKYNMEKADVASFTLESGCSYVAGSKDSYLHIPSGKTFTLDLNGNTIDRNLNSSTAKADGCVIFNEGNLTIKNTTGNGYIQGGYNTDTGDIHGGGICNAGTLTIQSGMIRSNTSYTYGGGIYNYGTVLTIEGGSIQNNGVTNSSYGGGIYHNGTTFNLQGDPYILGNMANSADNNIYLETGKIITITDKLTSTSTTPQIGITSKDDHPVFTSGLKGYDDDATKRGDAKKFKADLTTHDIGLKSDGEAIVGPKHTIYVDIDGYWPYFTVKNVDYVSSNSTTAVEGELIKLKVRGNVGHNSIPISISYPDNVSVPYPVENHIYEFDMPGENVSVRATFRYGFYCGDDTGSGAITDMKCYIMEASETVTLKFETKDANSYAMKSYGAQADVPWRVLDYNAIDIPTTVTSITPYAFYGKPLTTATIPATVTSIGEKAFMACTSLEEIIVSGGSSYASADGVLYNNDKTRLICYPAGKANTSQYELPASVTEIADGAFAFGTHLQTIAVATGNTKFMATSDGVLFNNDKTKLFYYPAGKTNTIYEVPTTATTIAPYAFHSASASLNYVFLLHSSLPVGGTSMFDRSDFNIMVKSSIINDYKTNAHWSDYGTTSNNRYLPIELTGATITLDNSYSLDYTGSALAPPVTSVVKYRTLTQGTDYTVSYSNNVNVGTATVTITGQGVYNGQEVTKNFNITRYVNFGATNSNYVTYYASENLNLPDRIQKGTSQSDGYSYYYAYAIESISWDTKTITLVNFSDGNNIGYIPANTAVLLYNDFSAPFNCVNYPTRFHLTKYGGTEKTISASAEFIGHETDKLYSDINPSNKPLYVLRNNKFTRVEGITGTLPARHCYIIDSGVVSSAPAYLSISGIDDNTTGITMEEGRGKTEELFSADWYTINGVKLNGMPTKKGIYINNGRKVIIK